MPLYACKCTECGKRDEVIRPVDQYREMPECCGKMMERVLTPLHVMGDMQPYRSPLDGKIVSSRAEHRKHMREHGVIEVGNEKLTRPMQKQYEPKEVREDVMKGLHQAGLLN